MRGSSDLEKNYFKIAISWENKNNEDLLLKASLPAWFQRPSNKPWCDEITGSIPVQIYLNLRKNTTERDVPSKASPMMLIQRPVLKQNYMKCYK